VSWTPRARTYERPKVALREAAVKSLLLVGVADLLLWIPTLFDFLIPLRDPERRSLEDRVAKTRGLRASVAIAGSARSAERKLVAA
jgi:hypothetical protein